jgi:hypothetical protein
MPECAASACWHCVPGASAGPNRGLRDSGGASAAVTQNGFTTARMTMPIMITVGTSLAIR